MAEWTIPNLDADPNWHGGRAHALVWALELRDPALALMAAARRRLGPALLGRYHRQPHVTVRYAGLMGAGGLIGAPDLPGYDQRSWADDLAHLRPLLQGPVPVVAQGWDSFPMVPYLGLAADWLHLAHAALPSPGYHGAMTYRPHLTVGQYAIRMPLDQVRTMLSGLPVDGEWLVGELSLLRYDTDDISGPLTAEGRLDLTSGEFRWSEDSILGGSSEAEGDAHGHGGGDQHHRLGQFDQ